MKKQSRIDAEARLNSEIAELLETGKFIKPTDLSEELKGVPTQIAAAIMAGRGNMVFLGPIEACSKVEVRKLYEVIKVLIDTNQVLRNHADKTAHLVKLWGDCIKGIHRQAQTIEHYANFREIDEGDTK